MQSSRNRLDYEKLRQDVEYFQDPETLRNVIGKQAVILMDLMMARSKKETPAVFVTRLKGEFTKSLERMMTVLMDRIGFSILGDNINEEDLKIERNFNNVFVIFGVLGLTFDEFVDQTDSRLKVANAFSDIYPRVSSQLAHLIGSFEEKLNVYVYYLRRFRALVAQKDFADMEDQAYNLAATCIVKATTLGMWLDVKI